MPDIWDYFRSLFKKAESSSPSQPLIHEVINRSAEEREDYEYWKGTLVRRRLRDWLNDQYAVFRVAPGDIDEALDFLNTPSSKGFVIYFYKTRYSRRDARHFFDYLKEQMTGIGYRPQVSDLRTYHRPEWVETVERHYLKPRPFFSGDKNHQPDKPAEKFDQRYGNVTIELLLRDDQVHHLRFRATTYRDHLFKEAADFKDLMLNLLA